MWILGLKGLRVNTKAKYKAGKGIAMGESNGYN